MNYSTNNQQFEYNPNMYTWAPEAGNHIDESSPLFDPYPSNTPPVYPSPYEPSLPPQGIATPNDSHYYQSNGETQLIAPLASFTGTVDLEYAVSRLDMNEPHQQRAPLSRNLSLEIQPCISITEPTPVSHLSSLKFVDQFIAQHSAQLDTNNFQEQQQQQQPQQLYHQEEQTLNQMLDPVALFDDLLGPQQEDNSWLSWTPLRGSSPVSVSSTSFEGASMYTPSPEFGFLDMSVSAGVPSPVFFSENINENNNNNNNNNAGNGSDGNNYLSIKKSRPRRVSEPPLPSSNDFMVYVSESSTANSSRVVRRSNSDRRARSNSSASASTSYTCEHPGCGKSFTRPYNLTSHMRTHTADRPYACSQCGRRFARQHDRNRHEKLHWGIKPYACKNCKKPFARMDALNRHLRVENGCGSIIEAKA